MRLLQCVLLSFSSVFLASCGSSLWTETQGTPSRGAIDGAVMTYALAKGEIAFEADVKDGVLSFSTDRKVSAVPDYGVGLRKLVYNHSGLSDDDVAIQLNGAIVKSVSTTTADKSVQAIQGATALLTQVAAAQTALIKANITFVGKPADTKPTSTCPNSNVTYVHGVTYGNAGNYFPRQDRTACHVEITVQVIALPNGALDFRSFANSDDAVTSPIETCETSFVFCFRRGHLFLIKARAQLYNGKDKLGGEVTLPDFVVTAPELGHVGYVRFDRRAFVANKTTLTFDDNGVLSGFSATNPSEVIGFISVPTAFAAGVAAAAALHR
jgi:hypothetical protein